jgi:hypothetical protein
MVVHMDDFGYSHDVRVNGLFVMSIPLIDLIPSSAACGQAVRPFISLKSVQNTFRNS